jgi:thiosulfate/3-mercaptopyruvate sulfurtransferase
MRRFLEPGAVMAMKFLFSILRLFSVLALTAALAAPAGAAEPLVSVQWLSQRLKDQTLLVLDIRSAIDGGGVEAYKAAHIPGAVHSDYDKAGWRVERNGVPFMLPSVPELEKLIGELGIDEDTHVVVVPAGVHYTDFGSAARTYWTLQVTGVKNVSILDGGFAAWKAANLPVENGVTRPSPKIFTATIDKSLIAQAAEVEKIEQNGGATLIDSRPATFFTGKEKTPAAQAYGRIPGAINIDSARFYDEAANRLKPKSELELIVAQVPDGPAVTYCNTGHWASTDWFVLHELLGRKQVRLYSGSMVEWTSNPARPLASSRTKWDDLMKVVGLGR